MTTAKSLDAPSVDLQMFYLERKKRICIVLIIAILVNNCSNKYEKKEHNIGDLALLVTFLYATVALVARLHSYTTVYFRVIDVRTTSDCSQHVERSCRVSFAFHLFAFTRMLVNS